MRHFNRMFYTRGRKGQSVFVSPGEYIFRFAHDAVKKNGELIGYVHNFYDEYIVVLPNLQALCFRPTDFEAREALHKFTNLNPKERNHAHTQE